MKKYLNVLKKCSLFKGIKDDDLISVLGCIGGYKKEFQKGEVLFFEGDRISVIGIVLSGIIQMERFDYNGNRSIVSTVGEEHIFGEAFACSETLKIPVDIVASSDSVILFIDVKRIIKTCSNGCSFHNKLVFNLLKAVSIKNIKLNQKIEITSKRTTRDKLLTYLYLKAEEEGKQEFVIPYNRQELADFLEVERSGLSMEISKLCKEGKIESKRNYFLLRDFNNSSN